MTPRRAPRARGMAAFLAAASLAALVAACGSAPSSSLSSTPGAGATTSLAPAEEGTPQASGSSASADASSLQSPVTGLVLHVDVAGLGRVTGFRLLVPGGQQVDFTMGTQENTAEFPAAHLSEHMASGDPVRVYFRRQGSQLVVYRLEDAAAASPSAPAASPSAPAAS